MARKRANNNYTIQPFQLGSDQNEAGILYINFRAENFAAAKAQAMIYVANEAFVQGIHGIKLLRNSAEVWRWSKGDDPTKRAEE
jgi:hypothetical protein